MNDLRGRIPPFDDAVRARALEHQRELTKPAGSLGRLEEIAAWYAGAHGRFPPPRPERIMVTVFAGDHGVAAEGVSAYPSSVTAAMVANMMAGGAAASVMARTLAADLEIVDVGVDDDLGRVPAEPAFPLLREKIRRGTGNIRREPAMSREQAWAALRVGERRAREHVRNGYALLAAGEVGIANTTAAAALVCAFTGARPEDAVGLGTGISEETRRHKVAVVRDALDLHAAALADPVDALAALGALELAAMAGFFLEAARQRVPVVLDGFLASAAALVAQAIDPRVVSYLLASHASAERGARIALDVLGVTPICDLGMRLGEGTGALLVAGIVRTSVELQLSMATFASANVARRI